MLADLQLFSYGAAAVLETVLLVAMIERRNRRAVTLWMLLVTLGAWLWHTGLFTTSLLAESSGQWLVQVQWLAMIVMASGLLLIPSALLHGIRRLQMTGLEVAPPPRAALAICYLPLIAVVPGGSATPERTPRSGSCCNSMRTSCRMSPGSEPSMCCRRLLCGAIAGPSPRRE